MTFDVRQHQYDYFNNLVTQVERLIPGPVCDSLAAKIAQVIDAGLVDHVRHDGRGTNAVSDLGGAYDHHIFKGDDIRTHLPELVAIYHAVLPLVSIITCSDAVVSPYPVSDINIKAYPPGGGTLGRHYDTNGITVLLFLTDNTEAPLCMQIERSHPSRREPWTEERKVFATKGTLLLMQGRKTLHESEPTHIERKITVVYNYYERHDTYRHQAFDDFVYSGKAPPQLV